MIKLSGFLSKQYSTKIPHQRLNWRMLAAGGNAIRINIHKRRVSYRLVLATNNTAVAGSLRRWAMRCLSQANLHPAASLLVPDPPFWVLSKELGAHGHWQIKWRGFTELLQMFTDSEKRTTIQVHSALSVSGCVDACLGGKGGTFAVLFLWWL